MAPYNKQTLLLTTLFFSLGWGSYSLTNIYAQEMTVYTVKEGNHFSFPRILKLKRNVKTVQWEVIFQDNCRYEIKEKDGSLSNDQADWNKLCGTFFSIFNTRKDAAMIGWRYNVTTQQIELAPYYHIDGSRDMFPPLVYTTPGERLSITLNINYETQQYEWEIEQRGELATHQFTFTHQRNTCGFINFYFGGNQPAPQEVSCEMALTISS